MLPNNHLFDLIQSLDKNEKRYISVELKSSIKSTTYKLYQALCNWDPQVLFDENKFILDNKSNILSKNYSTEKHRLYKFILKAMRAYDTNKSIYTKVYEHFEDVRFLYEKGLFTQAAKILSVAKDFAYKNHLYAELLIVNNYKQLILYHDKLAFDAIAYKKDIEFTLEKINSMNALYLKRLDIMEIYNQINIKPYEKKITAIISEFEKLYTSGKLSFRENILILNTLQYHYNKIVDFTQLQYISTELMSQYNHIKQEAFYSSEIHMKIIANYCNLLYRLELKDKMWEILQELKSFKIETFAEKLLHFKLYTNTYLLYLINFESPNFDYSSSLVEIEKNMLKYGHSISEKTLNQFETNIIVLHFRNKKFPLTAKHAFKYAAKYQNKQEYFFNILIVKTIYIVSLIKNKDVKDLLESQLRSWNRFRKMDVANQNLYKLIYKLFQLKIKNQENKTAKVITDLTRLKTSPKHEQLKEIVLY